MYSHNRFTSEFGHVLNDTHALSPTDINILLRYLSRDKQVVTYDSQTIKFASPPFHTPPSPITQQDSTIASVRTLILSLQTQTDALTSKITALDDAARTAVFRKSRAAALSSLRSKKIAEATLARRADTLAQLEELLAKIETAVDQVEVVRVMNASTAVLRSLHKEVGGVEGVEGVVEALAEEMDRVDEVGRVINEVGAPAVDEGEIDEEMEMLEKAERARVEEEEAEKTRKRLEAAGTPDERLKAKLPTEHHESVGQAQIENSELGQQTRGPQPENSTTDAEVNQESDELSRMSLEERRSSNAEEMKTKSAITE